MSDAPTAEEATTSTAAEAWGRPEIEYAIVERDALMRIKRAIERKDDERHRLIEHWDEHIPTNLLDLTPERDLRRATIFLLRAPEATLLQQVRERGLTPSMPEWMQKVQAIRRSGDVKEPTVRTIDENSYIEMPLSFRDQLVELDKQVRQLQNKYSDTYGAIREHHDVEEVGLGLVEYHDTNNGRIYFLTAHEAREQMDSRARNEPVRFPNDIQARMKIPRKNPKSSRKG